MLESIKINNEVIELLQFLWQTVAAGNKVSDSYISDIVSNPAMEAIYTEDFSQETARMVLSAIVNKEPLAEASPKAKEFYDFNFFNADDPGNVEMMLPIVKQLNVDQLKDDFNDETRFHKLIINFVGAYDISHVIEENVLTINFFKLGIDWATMDQALIEGQSLEDFIQACAKEILN
ncbi:TDE2712 family protein [Aerococcus sanguinicola]|uniref:TDE2712 family protein n=1 Tax=unclassified Aerococcus TaxID=2618060 RepID=UPI0008A356B8|nr:MULTISPECIES: hypothetical protein [unclassified Aerococcus]KAB0646796.1 hypothetical protein F6I01_05405 [Aerococcus sanguinicola]MDK6234301.1 hypothetical protein [Aerococcus sp. UMB10185]MDK6855475.1 hypothetical protein [Aerococcus sp. UMB7533]MDK8501653.1 hypothetical protein [Aerococcus sp. UMB1112A]OFN00566.1 hypothetical protein HMPREF2626_08885 [Aerococcus sp. HMSC062A02]